MYAVGIYIQAALFFRILAYSHTAGFFQNCYPAAGFCFEISGQIDVQMTVIAYSNTAGTVIIIARFPLHIAKFPLHMQSTGING